MIDSTTNKSKVLQNKYETKSFDNIGVHSATGKVVLNHVLICGGFPFSKYCIKLERDCQWTLFANMTKERIGAASIEMKDDNEVRILKSFHSMIDLFSYANYVTQKFKFRTEKGSTVGRQLFKENIIPYALSQSQIFLSLFLECQLLVFFFRSIIYGSPVEIKVTSIQLFTGPLKWFVINFHY